MHHKHVHIPMLREMLRAQMANVIILLFADKITILDHIPSFFQVPGTLLALTAWTWIGFVRESIWKCPLHTLPPETYAVVFFFFEGVN